jgi:hypothetical protein
MKILSGLVIAALLLHLQCGSFCLQNSFNLKIEAASTSPEPPCHKHAENPSKGQSPARDGNGPCSSGSAAESKLSTGGKVAFQFTAILPVEIGTLLEHVSDTNGSIPGFPPQSSFPIARISVLRI